MIGIEISLDGINIIDSHNKKITRNKGKSLIDFPVSYTVIDIETTGFDYHYDSIIEVCAIKYYNGKQTDKYTSLIKPDSYSFFDDEIDKDFCEYNGEKIQFINDDVVSLTGITNEMLLHAPSETEVLKSFYDFIDDSILVGHNINFDINFLYDSIKQNLSFELNNNFIDTLRIARKLHSDLKHHRLSDLCSYYDIDHSGAHRSEHDCTVTNEVYELMKNDIQNKYSNIDEFKKLFGKKKSSSSRINVNEIIASSNENFNEDSPIFERNFVFTGTLSLMQRKKAMQLVVNKGGFIGNGVNKKTNYLVLGNNDYCPQIKDPNGKSSKQLRAEKLKMEGQDIEIISENVFYDMLEM